MEETKKIKHYLTYHNLLPDSKVSPEIIIKKFNLTKKQYSKFNLELIKNELFCFNYVLMLVEVDNIIFCICSFNDADFGISLDFTIPFVPEDKDRIFDIISGLYKNEKIRIFKKEEIFDNFEDIHTINGLIVTEYLEDSLKNERKT